MQIRIRSGYGWLVAPAALLPSLVASSALALSLGAAGGYAGAALNAQQKFTISSGGTVVNGDVFVGSCGGGTCLAFSGGGAISGAIERDSSVPTVNLSGGSAAAGGTITLGAGPSGQIATDLAAALSQVSALTANQSLGAVSGNTTVTPTVAGLNVIDATSVNLQGGSTLAFHGNVGDFFVVRVSGKLTTGGNSNVAAGANIGAARVLFVVAGDVTTSGGTHDGIFVSTGGNVTLSGGVHNGAYLAAGAGKELKFQSAPTLNFRQFVPEPAAGFLLGVGLAGLALYGRRSG